MDERLLPPISDDIIACCITNFNQAVYSTGNNPVIAACAVYGITIEGPGIVDNNIRAVIIGCRRNHNNMLSQMID